MDIHFFANFQDYFQKGWAGRIPFLFFSITFPKNSTTYHQIFLETTQKVGKKVDFFFFGNVGYEKHLPVTNFGCR